MFNHARRVDAGVAFGFRALALPESTPDELTTTPFVATRGDRGRGLNSAGAPRPSPGLRR